ncbi:hypothetical protein NQ314_010621 [Rhamnusium bicolor]|uniref:Ubiquitin-conjugating enzyme E2C-binding protein n=1 Tax=Rhamnusium bicolor TaxID=1586634 RepID=A0AAV8XP51_9CUCU|nr:hypothetical protein NQ314_010621 [Rhamnusium bicolor]
MPLPPDNANNRAWSFYAHSSKDNLRPDPKETDIFYTHCYVHINKNNIVNTRGNGKVVVCKFCLSWLGTAFNQNTLRIWFNTVTFSVNNATTISTISLNDVLDSIKDILKQSIYTCNKLLLICQTSDSQVDSILLWIMEKQLEVLFEESEDDLKNMTLLKFCLNLPKVMRRRLNSGRMIQVLAP